MSKANETKENAGTDQQVCARFKFHSSSCIFLLMLAVAQENDLISAGKNTTLSTFVVPSDPPAPQAADEENRQSHSPAAPDSPHPEPPEPPKEKEIVEAKPQSAGAGWISEQLKKLRI